jgi:hypothetical protein
LNPYKAPKAELFWMTPEERLQSRLNLSAKRWAVFAALSATLQVALSVHLGLLFVVVHGAMASFAFALGAMVVAGQSYRWVLARWQQWIRRILLDAGGMLAAGLVGIGAAALILSWVGHPAPLGPLANLETRMLVRLLAAAYALVLACCATWAMAWRWKLGTLTGRQRA